MKQYNFYIYILANKKHGTLYIGVTNDLIRRTSEHKNKMIKNSFTEKYGIDKLVYYEHCTSSISAISREKQIKGWNRDWKIKLIEKNNKDWKDLYSSLFE
jgi:putative endonuclease